VPVLAGRASAYSGSLGGSVAAATVPAWLVTGRAIERWFAPPASVLAVALPEWFGTVKLLFVLGGHVLAVWVAHSLAFELFPGVLSAVRSQYPSVATMIFYTMTSLWVLTQPYAPPPFV
jgi:uncharacterized membrane protein YcfT